MVGIGFMNSRKRASVEVEIGFLNSSKRRLGSFFSGRVRFVVVQSLRFGDKLRGLATPSFWI